jgi:transposase
MNLPNHAQPRRQPPLSAVHPHATGLDVGAECPVVAVPPACDPEPVRSCRAFTGDLHCLADWLVACGIKTVAMASTGVYWIPLYETLAARGLPVLFPSAGRDRGVAGLSAPSGCSMMPPSTCSTCRRR